MFTMGRPANYEISFPFKFSVLKSDSAIVTDFRSLKVISSSTKL